MNQNRGSNFSRFDALSFDDPRWASFEDDMQGLSAAYLAAANFLKLERPSRQQVTAAKGSARDLQSLADVCFTPERRPEAISEADWKKAREGLKSLAAQVLAWR